MGLCFTLSLDLVFGSVFSSSPSAFAVDMGGTMDGGGGNDGNNMPPPEDAPATTDALAAGGGSNDDDGDDNDDNDDDSGRSRDDDDDDDDNDKLNEPTSADAPATADALTAKEIECPEGQEVPLFSTTCELGGSKTTYKGILGETIEETTFPDGTIKTIAKDKDQNIILSSTTHPDKSETHTHLDQGKVSFITRLNSLGQVVEQTTIAPDDSFTETSSYEPGYSRPVKSIIDYRDGRKVTLTFDGNVNTQSEFNPQDGWTTTKSTDQRNGLTTTTITKTNPDGSVSSKDLDNTITTQNIDGTWFITYPPSADGSVKTYHSDGRTTIEKSK